MARTAFLDNAPMITTRVTKDVIAEAIPRDSSHCMIAEALRHSHPKLSRIAVDIQTVRATNKEKKERYIWLTPRSVQEMIVNFDRGKKPKPFAIKLAGGQTVEMRPMSTSKKKKPKTRKVAVKKARLRQGSHRGTLLPQINGGHEPPASIGRRRSFGLRSFQV